MRICPFHHLISAWDLVNLSFSAVLVKWDVFCSYPFAEDRTKVYACTHFKWVGITKLFLEPHRWMVESHNLDSALFSCKLPHSNYTAITDFS